MRDLLLEERAIELLARVLGELDYGAHNLDGQARIILLGLSRFGYTITKEPHP